MSPLLRWAVWELAREICDNDRVKQLIWEVVAKL